MGGLSGTKEEDMEVKRRQEHLLKQKHDRMIVEQIGVDLKVEQQDDKEVQQEIERLARTYDPYKEKVAKRAELMDRMTEAVSPDEIEAIKRQIKDLDDDVKRELGKEEKIQDEALRKKLEERKMKKQAALKKERDMKSDLLQQRIEAALQNSDDFNFKKKEMTTQIINEMISSLQNRMTEAEIPSAIEKLVEENHSRELQDLLLKIYEQKCVELKEEILSMMQEKIARQQLARKNNHDRKRGIDAIISRVTNQSEKKRLEAAKAQCDQELEKEIRDIENEYVKLEADVAVRIQRKSLDRENERVAQLQEEQLKEKQLIFEKLLPESMLHTFIKGTANEELIELEKLRQDLAVVNAERIRQLEEQKQKDSEAMLKGQAAVDALAEKNRLQREQMDKLDSLNAEQMRRKQDKLTAEERIKEAKEQFMAQNKEIQDLLNNERVRQLEATQQAYEDRKRRKEEQRVK